MSKRLFKFAFRSLDQYLIYSAGELLEEYSVVKFGL
jgi:hypothetical protein